MYALTDSAEGDCYLSVPPDPGIEAAALGASASAAPGTGESAASGTGESALSGTAPTEALRTFTLDSGASRSFFCDSTTLTPLSRPVAVSLTDPSGGPVLAHSSTVLPCPAAPSGLLSGLHLPSFSTNLVSGADLQDAWVAASSQVFAAASRSSPASAPCSCRPLSHETLLWHHRLGHPSVPRLRGMASRTLVSGLPRCLPPLPPGPAPTCVPCVEGRQRAAPQSSSFPPTEAPLQTLHMDVWGPARVCGQGHERYFLLVVDVYSRYTSVFPLRSKDRGGEFSSDLLRAFSRAEGIRQTFTLPASPQQNGITECRIGMVMDVARTSMIHAAAPHFLWPFAVQYAAHQINLKPRVSLPEITPTLRWTGKVGDGSAFREVTFDESVSYYHLFPYRAASLSPPPLFLAPDPAEPVEVAVDSGAVRGAEPVGARTGGAEPGGVESWGAEPERVELGGAELERVEPGGAVSEGAESGGSPGVPLPLCEWYARRCRRATRTTGAGAAGGAASAGATGGAAGAGAAGGAAGAGAAGGAAGASAAGGAAGAGAPGGVAGAGAAGGTARAGAAGGAAGAGAAGAAGPGGARTGGTGAAGVGGNVGVGAAGTEAGGAAKLLPTHLSGRQPWTQRWLPGSPHAPTVKRLRGSPPVFKARCVARGFSQRQGGSLHEEIWLRRPPCFTGSFPAGTQWSLRWPVYGLRQAPREWHDTLRTTLATLGFDPSTADPSLFLRTDTFLPLFYVLVYVGDLVFATADTEALAHVNSELQKRHTCTDLGELTSYLGLRITRDRAQRIITLTQSHMVHQVLQRFGFTYSSPQSTPLPTGHSLSAPPSDESVEPSGPYPELVGCLITSGMGLVLGGRARVVLTGHADASWVDDLATQRSSQGYTFSLAGPSGSGGVRGAGEAGRGVLGGSAPIASVSTPAKDDRPASEGATKEWDRRSKDGFFLLSQCLSSNQLHHIKHLIKDIQCGTKALKILKDVHAPSSEAMVVVLERQLHAVKINEGDAVQGAFDQLRDLYVKLSAAGVDYPKNIKCYKALSLLPESWGPLVVNLNGMKDSWSLEWIRAQVLQEEFRRKELTAAAGEGGGSAYGMKGFKGRGSKKGKAKEGSGGEQYSGGKRSNKGGKRCGGKCWYCHVEGHPWFKCRKLLDGWRPGQPSIEGCKGVHGAMGEGMGSEEGDGGAGGHGGMFYHVGEACSEDMVVPASKVALHRSSHWVIDTGAFMTMTNREDLLDEVRPSKAATVVSATGQVVPVRGEGRAMFMGADGRLVGLKRVLLVPGLCANLLSTKALSEAGMKMEMMGTKVFKATLDGRVLWDLRGSKDMHRSMWEIPVLPWKEAAARLAAEAVRRGHASHVTSGGGGDGSDGGLLVHGGGALPSIAAPGIGTFCDALTVLKPGTAPTYSKEPSMGVKELGPKTVPKLRLACALVALNLKPRAWVAALFPDTWEEQMSKTVADMAKQTAPVQRPPTKRKKAA
ncbi:unnamed protein product [Closterium sp. NIES-53]